MVIPVRIDNRIRLRDSDLTKEVRAELKHLFEHKNPGWFAKKAMGFPTWGEPQTLTTWRLDGGMLTFPRGGMQRIRDVLREGGIGLHLIDERCQGAPDVLADDIPKHQVELWPFQSPLVEKALKVEQGIIKAPTGSGKTTIIYALISRIPGPSLVLLPNAALLEQWRKRAQREFGMAYDDIGIIRGAKRKLRPVTLGLPHTVSKGLTETEQTYFRAIFADEAQKFAAMNQFFGSIDQSRAQYRIATSADETRKDKKEFMVYDVFGKVIAEVKRDDLIASGHILDVEIRVVPTEFRADWYGIPEPPTESGEFELSPVEPEEPKQLDWNRLLDEMRADTERQEIIHNVILEVAKRDKRQIIVFSHRREHCLAIDRWLSSRRIKTGFLIGSDDYRVEFEKTVAGIERGTLQVGVGTFEAAGYGLDLPSVGAGLATTPIAANRQFFGQVCGRLCRIDRKTKKASAVLYVVWDKHVYPAHLKNIVRWNRTVKVATAYSQGEGYTWIGGRDYLKRAKVA